MSNTSKQTPAGDNKPAKTTPAPPAPVHPAVDLEGWVQKFNPKGLAERLATELNHRGLRTPEDFSRPHANQEMVAAVQKVIGLEALVIMQSVKKEKN